MSNMSCGEAWLTMRDMSIKDLTRIASAQGFHLDEEMARSLLRNKLVARRLRNTKGLPAPKHLQVKARRRG